MPEKVQIFDELLKGFRDAIARKKGLAVGLRVTETPRVKPMRSTGTKKGKTPIRPH